ncbi:uncharacterized protein UBRO2_05882 [Ustilago bromivora]|uniref:Uncharacterized protein n=1 Tax=Ustilago bromivora TaxID=307758 RepID=A0A8H8QSA9_9BASI|nr:uncharacterized protein UBRO2_05882 [Ustilago bromivora]
MGNLNQPFVTPTGTQDDAATSIEMHTARYMTYIAWEAKNRDEPQPGAGSGKPDTINGTECPRLCIRGVTNKHAYPYLDVLKIQAIFDQILTALAEIPMFKQFNVVSNLIWNDCIQPALPSISVTGVSNPAAAAAATDDDNGAPQCKRQHMDLD